MDSLQRVLDALPDAVVVVDQEGLITQANRHVTDVLGYTSQELEGMVVEELLLEGDRESHVRFRRGYMADPEPRPMGRELDLYARRKDGTSVPVEISLGPIERDGALSVLATISDITKRKQRERELEAQYEQLDQFASVVSHDLRNPLRVAEGSLELAREECNSDHLERVDRALERMDGLIEDLLMLARAGQTVTDFEPVELAALAEDCWATVETANATLVTDIERSIEGDKRRLRQLIENLVRNAVEHGDDDVTVTVGGLADGFYVEDDGAGIPDAERDEVFDAGYSTSDEGIGFGLNIVAQVVDAHDWEISVTDGSVGGARFEITGVAFAEE